MAAINDGKIYKRDFSLCDSNKNSSNKLNKKEKEVIDIFVAKSKTEDLYWNDYDYAWTRGIDEATRISEEDSDYQWYLDCGKFTLVKIEK